MATRTDTFDLGALRLTAGEGRQLELGVTIEPFELGGHTYSVTPIPSADTPEGAPPSQIDVRLGISRMTGSGYALHIAFGCVMHGPCMRCLDPAAPEFHVDAREVSQPGEDDDEFVSPYVLESMLDLNAWARDALALALPAALLCRPDCLGLCAICGANLNTAGPEHVHAPEPDPRWAVLSELKLDAGEATPDADPAAAATADADPPAAEA